MCDDTSPSTFIQDLGHFLTHTATACAQACIAYNAVVPAGSPLCNSAEFHPVFRYDAGAFVASSGSSTKQYETWNCWIKVVRNICGPAPPQHSLELQDSSLLVMMPVQSNCARPQLPVLCGTALYEGH